MPLKHWLHNARCNFTCGIPTQQYWQIAPILLVTCLALPAAAQQQIQILAVVNAASYQVGIPEPGALATIFCSGLTGITGIVTAPSQTPLPLQLAGVNVSVNLGATPLLAVADLGGGYQLINFQVPPERLLTRTSQIQITQNGSAGVANNLDYPGVGGLFADASGNAAAFHVADGSMVTTQSPAHGGELIVIYGTGLGSTYPPKPIGFPVPAVPRFQGIMDYTEPATSYNLDMPAHQVTLDSTVVHVSFSGLAPGYAGVDQLIVQVPNGLAAGTHSLGLAAGVISCLPPPFAQPCTFEAHAKSNAVKIPVQ